MSRKDTKITPPNTMDNSFSFGQSSTAYCGSIYSDSTKKESDKAAADNMVKAMAKERGVGVDEMRMIIRAQVMVADIWATIAVEKAAEEAAAEKAAVEMAAVEKILFERILTEKAAAEKRLNSGKFSKFFSKIVKK